MRNYKIIIKVSSYINILRNEKFLEKVLLYFSFIILLIWLLGCLHNDNFDPQNVTNMKETEYSIKCHIAFRYDSLYTEFKFSCFWWFVSVAKFKRQSYILKWTYSIVLFIFRITQCVNNEYKQIRNRNVTSIQDFCKRSGQKNIWVIRQKTSKF